MSTNETNRSTVAVSRRFLRIQNPKALFLGWLPVVIGLAAWIASAFQILDWLVSAKMLGLFTAVTISVIVHEMAHFIAARSLGLKPWCLRIGHGQPVFNKEFHSFRLMLQSLPYSGAIYPYLLGTRSERLAMIWAGPLSNAILFMIFLPRLLNSTDVLDFDSISMQMLLANASILVATAIPRQTSTGPNDAMVILHLLRGTAPEHERRASSTLELTPSWSWLIKNHRPEVLLNHYRDLLQNSKISPDQRCLFLDAFATCVLMMGASEFLAEADIYSDELLRLKPSDWSVKGTRGSVLVEKGDLPAGVALLEEVMANDSNPFDRAISASYLALAKSKEGDHAEAHRWLAIAEQIDEDCPATIRIATIVKSTTPRETPTPASIANRK